MTMSIFKNKKNYVLLNLCLNKNLLITSSKRYISDFKSIPGPVSLPGIGTLYQYFPIIGRYRFDELYYNGIKKYKKFGPVVREEIVPGVNIVLLYDPRDIEVMFRCEGKYPQRRSHLALEKYRFDKPNVYNTGGLLPTNGPDWFRLRTVFQKGLSSPSSVKNFLKGSDEITQEWLITAEELCNNGPKRDYLPELSRLFLELTGYVILDIRLNSFSREERRKNSRSSKLINAALETNACILETDNGPQLWRKIETPLYRRLRKSQEYMEEVAIDLLSLKMSFFNEKKINAPATLLESYLSSPELDFKDVIGIVCDFFLAGIDTTTNSTSFLLYHVATHPEVQNILYQEACKLLPTSSSPVTSDVLQQSVYAKAVLKESLRLRPISIGIGRILEREAVFSGYSVPSQTVVVSQNQVSCRLEEYFPYPHKFKPERWLKNNPLYKQSHPFLVIPFGHGPRSCIARRLAEQNMLVLLLKMVRNFKLGWSGGSLDSKSYLINKPDGPIYLNFSRRE